MHSCPPTRTPFSPRLPLAPTRQATHQLGLVAWAAGGDDRGGALLNALPFVTSAAGDAYPKATKPKGDAADAQMGRTEDLLRDGVDKGLVATVFAMGKECVAAAARYPIFRNNT